MLEQSTQLRSAANLPWIYERLGQTQLRLIRRVDDLIPKALMRTMIIVEVHIRMHEIIRVPKTEAGEVIQTLPGLFRFVGAR